MTKLMGIVNDSSVAKSLKREYTREADFILIW